MVATLESTKTGIKLDLNGKKLTLTVSNPITNKGELDVYNSSSAAAGTIIITGGTITSAANCIEAAYGSAKSITIGSNDGYVNISTPIIQTTGNSSKYGIRFWDDTTFNFYDGVIKSASGTGYAIQGTISDKPSGYNLYKETIGGVEELKLINN